MTWVDVLMSLSPADLSPQACLRFWRETARRVFGKLWSLTRADFADLTGVFKTAHKKP